LKPEETLLDAIRDYIANANIIEGLISADILETAKLELEAAGCSIPYPQTDVHLRQITQD